MVKKVTKKALNEVDFSHDEEYDNPENYESDLKLKKILITLLIIIIVIKKH